MEKKFFTVKEFSKVTGLSTATIYRKINNRQIRAVRIGGPWRIPTSDVEELWRPIGTLPPRFYD
jgi:excisionase family DNA binding protein